MTQKNKKQFGVWMDGHNATVVGRANPDAENFTVLGMAANAGSDGNTSDNKFFKEILSHMQNAEQVHVTGTGVAQEQLMHYMAATPQFKNTTLQESTSNKMSDESLGEYIAGKFN